MTHSVRQPPLRVPDHRGFALVITVSLMVLLAVVAVGLLTLSTVAIRNTGDDAATARANARLALLLALGDLQKSAGIDQAITAGAEVSNKDSAHPHWIGAWSPLDPASEALPDYDKNARFRQWFVSTPNKEDATKPTYPESSSGSNLIPLLGIGTLGADSNTDTHVRAPSVPIKNSKQNPTGSYAWWISDDSTKARITLPDRVAAAPLTRAQQSARLASPARPGTQAVAAFAGIDPTNPTLPATPSKSTIELNDPTRVAEIRSHWHDFTTSSRALLTDVREGGLKKDLSLLFEQDALPRKFRFLYTHIYGHPRKTNNYWLARNYAFGSPRWDFIHDYYNLYKDITYRGDIPQINHRVRIGASGENYRNGVITYQKEQTIMPVFAKFQFIMSAQTVTINREEKLALITDPVVTVWNPYQVRLKVKNLQLNPWYMPWEFIVTTSESSKRLHHMDVLPHSELRLNFPVNLTLEPGETRVYSNNIPEPIDVKGRAGWTNISLTEGWGGNGGYYHSDQTIAGEGSVRIDLEIADENTYEWNRPWTNRVAGLYFGTKATGTAPPWAMETWLEAAKVSDNGLLTVQGQPNTGLSFESLLNNKTEICSANFFLKSPGDPRWPSRSWIHGNASAYDNHMFVYNANSGGETEALEFAQNRLFMSVQYAGDLDLVQIEAPPSSAGFIASGQSAGDGVSFAVHQEIPVSPLQSIPQLQHANLISTGFAPFQSKAVGNSLAHPMLKQDSIREDAYKTQNRTEELDHSYWLNDVLFDEWFFSTLTGETSAYFRKHGHTRSLSKVYDDFVAGRQPLRNPRFVHLSAAGQTSDSARDALIASRSSIQPDGYLHTAAQLGIEGPFNINSTSKEAWKMMLSSLNGHTIPFLKRSRNSFNGDKRDDARNPVSRFSLPTSDSVERGQNEREAKWLGFRELTDDQLDALATEMVKQVQLRGPFLSLSEFVNRRVSDGDLGLMGALQAAIEETDINDDFKTPAQMISAQELEGAAYDNLRAAEGSRSTGAPGYLMQSDLLTPLAPVMTARGDTFTIRAYGDARDASGAILARAWCEAVVQRVIDYIDPSDSAETDPDDLTSEANKTFGRRFNLISFRWLTPDSV